jgi:hypothetical protein
MHIDFGSTYACGDGQFVVSENDPYSFLHYFVATEVHIVGSTTPMTSQADSFYLLYCLLSALERISVNKKQIIRISTGEQISIEIEYIEIDQYEHRIYNDSTVVFIEKINIILVYMLLCSYICKLKHSISLFVPNVDDLLEKYTDIDIVNLR